jgi:hypothetical protein
MWRDQSSGSWTSFTLDQYTIIGDTVVNNHNYYLLYNRPVVKSYYQGYYYSSFPPEDTVGYFRNDSLNKKVWMLGNNWKDTLLYDFDLKIGDTLQPTLLHDTSEILVVDSIDSILVGVNFHRRFHIAVDTSSTYPIDLALIEGVGSISGFMKNIYFHPLGQTGHKLACLKDSSGLLYLDSNYVFGCQLATNHNSTSDKNIPIDIYPNPNSGSFTIEPGDQAITLRLFDSAGRLLWEEEVSPGATPLFHIPGPAGLYLLQGNGEDGGFFSKKVVKK